MISRSDVLWMAGLSLLGWLLFSVMIWLGVLVWRAV